jgi:hypothetical protein
MSDVDDATRDYLLEAVEVFVRSGFATEEGVLDAIEQRVEDELGEPDASLVEELHTVARRMLVEQRAAEAGWHGRTTNDRIDAAFDELNEHGIVALQNVGFTLSDAWSDVNDAAAELDPPPRGAAFYHEQDLESGVRGDGLFIAFGAFEQGAKHEAASLAVAKEVCATLERHGVGASWDGSIKTRIRIPPFEWRKRRTTKAPPEFLH